MLFFFSEEEKNNLYISVCAKSHGCTLMVCKAKILDLGMDVAKVDAPRREHRAVNWPAYGRNPQSCFHDDTIHPKNKGRTQCGSSHRCLQKPSSLT